MSRKLTVALVGPDGAGKSTVAHKLIQDSPLPIKYIYMGVNLESSNKVLPTTRLLLKLKRAQGGHADIATRPVESYKLRARPKSFKKRLSGSLRSALRLINLTAEEWYRQFLVWYYTLRGYHVIFDRHFYFDYYAHDIVNDEPERPLHSRIHGFMLKNLYPKPDFVIFLDAPAEVLFARKPEGSLDARERRRQEYIEMRNAIDSWAVVDVTQPMEAVVNEVHELIRNFRRSGSGAQPVKQW